MKALYFTAINLILSLGVNYGQEIQIIADINPGPGSSLFNEYNIVIEFDGKLFFTANDGTHGHEVWVYDGSEALMLKDIYSGPGNSNAQNYFVVGDQIIFTAQDSAHGMEWWSTDGTEEGTQLVEDIYPGITGSVFVGNNNRRYFHQYNGAVYFTGAHRPNDYELWKTDGTAAGTILVKNISPDGFGNFSSFPEDYAEYKGNLYFSSREGLWKTNGTTAGTVLVEDEDPEDVFGLMPVDLISNGEYLFFIQNSDLWRSDGTSAGTMKVKDLEYINLNWFGNRFTVLGNIVLFPGADVTHGEELWRSDGTPAGTYLVVDLDPGSDGYSPQNNIAFNGKMYYKGDDGNSGIEFWSSDGTVSGTKLVKDIVPGSSSGFYLPTEIYTDGEHIFMSAGGAFEKELWISDGTTTGTFEFDINPNGESSPGKFYKYGEKLFLFAYTEEFGTEPYILDLTMTSSDDFSNSKLINVYPNPTNGLVHIYSSNVGDAMYTLFNMKGQVMAEKENVETIDLSRLTEGVYFLRHKVKSTGKVSYVEILLSR